MIWITSWRLLSIPSLRWPDSVKIRVITERMIKLVNEKERLHADGNIHISIEEKGQEVCDFLAALHMMSSSNDKVGEISRRVPRDALGQVTANEVLIS